MYFMAIKTIDRAFCRQTVTIVGRTPPLVSRYIRCTVIRIPVASLAFGLLAPAIAAQSPQLRVDLTGPFVHAGAVAGSVSGELAANGESHGGGGWSVGGGMNLSSWSAVVANYSIFNFRDTGAAERTSMEQTEVGLRLRIGGRRTSAVFYVEGGGAMQRASLSTARVFPGDVPADAGDVVDVDGWAGWFGPGLQVFRGPRLAGEVAVAWEWGDISRARIQGRRYSLNPPIDLTTLRLRLGVTATLF
jgi:hypothetical protein